MKKKSTSTYTANSEAETKNLYENHFGRMSLIYQSVDFLKC